MKSIQDSNDHKFDQSEWNEQRHNQRHWYQWKIELKKTDQEKLNARI